MEKEEITSEEQAQEVVEQPRGRAKAMQYYKGKYADRFAQDGATDPEDDEMYEDLLGESSGKDEQIGRLTEANGKYQEDSEKLVTLIDSNPDLADLLSTLNDDSEFMVSIATRRTNQKAMEEAAEQTVKNIMDWQSAESMSDEDRAARVEWIVDLAKNVDSGVITKEIWDMAGKAMNYNADMEAAAIAAANAEIDKKKVPLVKEEEMFPDMGKSSAGKQTFKKNVDEPVVNKNEDYFDQLEKVR